MLSIKYRPKVFEDVRGQELPKIVLSSIVKNPENSPRTIILSGSTGVGKTTLSRIFARALNCTSKDSKPCMECENCKSFSENSSRYSEYDCADLNISKVKEMKDMFYYSLSSGYRVITFDETHLASKDSQSALLKPLEESPKGVFFVFCTTDLHKLLPTIVGRAINLELTPLSEKELYNLLDDVASKESIELTPESRSIIVRRSGGHARNLLQYLDLYSMSGEAFVEKIPTLDLKIKGFLDACASKDTNGIKKLACELVSYPVTILDTDFSEYVKMLADSVYLNGDSDKYKVSLMKNYMKVHKYLNTSVDWYMFLLTIQKIYNS